MTAKDDEATVTLVRGMLEDGLSVPAIARELNRSANGLYKFCARNGLGSFRARRRRIYVTAELGEKTVTKLEREAEKRDVSREVLARAILCAVAEDNLFIAILDQ